MWPVSPLRKKEESTFMCNYSFLFLSGSFCLATSWMRRFFFPLTFRANSTKAILVKAISFCVFLLIEVVVMIVIWISLTLGRIHFYIFTRFQNLREIMPWGLNQLRVEGF